MAALIGLAGLACVGMSVGVVVNGSSRVIVNTPGLVVGLGLVLSALWIGLRSLRRRAQEGCPDSKVLPEE